MEPHSVPNDLYRGLHCGPDSRFLNTPAQAPFPPKCFTLLHVLSSNLCLFVLIYSSLSIRPYLFVSFWSNVCLLVVMFGLKTIEILRPETQTPQKRKLGAWLFKENPNLVLLGLTCKSTNLDSLSRTLPCFSREVKGGDIIFLTSRLLHLDHHPRGSTTESLEDSVPRVDFRSFGARSSSCGPRSRLQPTAQEPLRSTLGRGPIERFHETFEGSLSIFGPQTL
jgi:hypothetical protein